jgi:4-coumarate--CoA ligase
LTAIVLTGPYLGCEVVVISKFDLERFCGAIERKKITWAPVVPPVVLLLAKSPVVDRFDLSSLRVIGSGAAPLTKDLVSIVRKRLNVPVRQGYGLSETSPCTHIQVSLPNHPLPRI